jgi:hypothetical protein
MRMRVEAGKRKGSLGLVVVVCSKYINDICILLPTVVLARVLPLLSYHHHFVICSQNHFKIDGGTNINILASLVKKRQCSLDLERDMERPTKNANMIGKRRNQYYRLDLGQMA